MNGGVCDLRPFNKIYQKQINVKTATNVELHYKNIHIPSPGKYKPVESQQDNHDEHDTGYQSASGQRAEGTIEVCEKA